MAKNNVWLSVSDLMTGLMIIFLFIAIAYIKRVQDNQNVLTQYVDNRKELHNELVAEFKSESERGQISIHGDLSMRFENAQTLFESGSDSLSLEFKEELANYMPRYLSILLKAAMKDRIREIRVEGHTDDVPYPLLDADPYFANLKLSQNRALNVMRYIQSLPEYQQYSEENKRLLEYWFTATGMSYGRALDNQGSYVYQTKNNIDKSKSRRVEIRLITAGEEMLEEFVEKSK